MATVLVIFGLEYHKTQPRAYVKGGLPIHAAAGILNPKFISGLSLLYVTINTYIVCGLQPASASLSMQALFD